MNSAQEKNINALPVHIAIIMDGNGRWAKLHGKDRIFGHHRGVESVRKIIEAAAETGIQYLTLYAFSMENWSRPDKEVEALMGLMVESLNNETDTLLKNNIRLNAIGNLESLSPEVRSRLLETIELTSSSTGMDLIIAMSYSSRWEITEAARRMCDDISAGKAVRDNISEEEFGKYLATKNFPDPDLMIRTSGEMRLSNFLLWQLAYTELYFTPKLWPDFGKEDLMNAIEEFGKRERRFGKTSEQIQKNERKDGDHNI